MHECEFILPILKFGEVNVFIIQPDKLDEIYLTKCWDWLSREEKERYVRFNYSKDRHEYLVGKILTRYILSYYTNSSPGELVFIKNRFGKPSLKYAAGTKFNLSHSSGANVFAVSYSHCVGIDIEKLDDRRVNAGFIDSFCSSNELSEFSDLDDKKCISRFFLLWTLKEAFVKAIGKGLSYPLTNVSFTFCEKNVRMSVNKMSNGRSGHWSAKVITIANNYICSLILLSPNGKNTNKHFYQITQNLNCVPFQSLNSYQGKGVVDYFDDTL